MDETAPEPWWHAPWRLVALGLALMFLAGAIGVVAGQRFATDAPNAVDIGFAQDMRAHHDQGVAMGALMMKKPLGDGDPDLRVIAEEIVLGQQLESGGMVEMLRRWGEAEANESGTAMTWMNEKVPLERMPGMATEANLEALAAASGAAADEIFVRLMTAHHDGGIHMAEFAAEEAAVAETRAFAEALARNQGREIVELQQFLRPS